MDQKSSTAPSARFSRWYLLPLAALGLITAFAAAAWAFNLRLVINSPASQVVLGMREAEERQAAGDLVGALDAYRLVIEQYHDTADVAQAVEAFVRLGVQTVPQPCQIPNHKEAGELLTNYEALPVSAKTSAASSMVAHRLMECAQQMGTNTVIGAGIAAYLLDEARLIAVDPAQRKEVGERADAVHWLLAARLEQNGSPSALEHFNALPQDTDAQARARRVIESFGASPSLWVASDKAVSAWILLAQEAGKTGDAAQVRGQLAAAQAEHERTARLLDKADDAELERMAESMPGYQEVMVALAERQRARGEPEAAAHSLARLGSINRMTVSARLLLARCLQEMKRLEDANLVLVTLLQERGPEFHREVRQLARMSRLGANPQDIERHRMRLADSAVVATGMQASVLTIERAQLLGTQEERVLMYESTVATLAMIEPVTREVVDCHFYLGIANYRLGRTKRANAYFDELLKRNDPELSLRVADELAQLGETERADEIRTQVLAAPTPPR